MGAPCIIVIMYVVDVKSRKKMLVEILIFFKLRVLVWNGLY